MRNKERQSNTIQILSILFLLLSSGGHLTSQNLKVFILAGQSNMEGHGEIIPDTVPGTLSYFLTSPEGDAFDYLLDDNDDWVVNDDVWVRYERDGGSLLTGNLSIGYGVSNEQIGPELGIGSLMGQYHNEQVLIIKTCWGGKSLAADFRPPSSGGTTGEYYNRMITDVQSAIQNISTEFPQYTGGTIDIAGFYWFQGWNDGEQNSYLAEYEQNLIHLIADVRTDLNVPDMPVVIGLTGLGGREIEPGDGWINRLQTQLVPAQISAALSNAHTNVSFVETRDFWRDGDDSPDPGALHHWRNNAESYLRIGIEMGVEMIQLLNADQPVDDVIDPEVGGVRNNTNPALPESYNYKEYVFAEPNDQGTCLGIQNNTATIEEVYLSQTHRRAIDHPFFFTVGYRPAVLQIAVTGTGASPDVTVTGTMNGSTIGELCLSGPANLSSAVDLSLPNFEDFFSVTLPKSWIKDGLSLTIEAGAACQVITQAQLKIGPYTEINLVEVKMDILDYNVTPVIQNKQSDLLEELASAFPASVVRYGNFPEVLTFPEYVMSNNVEQLLRFSSTTEYFENDFNNEASTNATANLLLENIQNAMGDNSSTVYFGNTLNLNPGGWGGNKSFVAADYDNVFIHEMGHSLSLPHWENFYNVAVDDASQYLYPYGGELNDGGGIGEAWTFIQHEYAFVDPNCVVPGNANSGLERSSCMQREIGCNQWRGTEEGPWEGFSDFGSYCVHQYLVGGAAITGQVSYKDSLVNFQIPQQEGFPTVSLENGKRVLSRDPLQPQESGTEDWFNLPGEEQLNQDLYLLYGSIHGTQDQANIIYAPIKMKGTLVPTIDPTDPQMFATLQNLTPEEGPGLYDQTRDITLKLFYDDGTIRHVLVPHESFDRVPNDDYGIWRTDIVYFAVTAPADKNICSVEMYERPFFISDEIDNRPDNINYASNNITAGNFMSAAVLKAQIDFACNCTGTPDYVLPGTPCDDGNPDTYNDIEDGNCNCAGTPIADDCNLINNGRFSDDNITGWWTWGNTTTVANGIANFSAINQGDAGFAQGPFDLLMDSSYVIIFDAYSNENRMMNVYITANEDPYTRYFSGTVSLSSSRQTYSLNLNMSADDQVEIEFNFDYAEASEGTAIFLDQVSLRTASCLFVDPCLENVMVNSVATPGYHIADKLLSANAQITSAISLQFKAGEAIELLPNFLINKDAVLSADISPCTID